MADKTFKSIDEQIHLLHSRGLTIECYEKAAEFLLRNNYYRVSGYSLTLRNHDQFYPKASFQNIMDIYFFDHELRHLLLHFLEKIEVAFKSIYAYEFTAKYGPAGYLNPEYFTNSERHSEIIGKGNAQRDKRHAHEAYLKHFMDDLKQEIPFWAYVDLLTIADISLLYECTEPSVKINVAARFGLNYHAGPKLLGQFMHSMTILRNLCAHGGRLFNRLFEQKPNLNKEERALLRTEQDKTVDNAHLYGFILNMRRLLTPQEFAKLKDGLISISEKYPFVAMRYYGFRDDWREKL